MRLLAGQLRPLAGRPAATLAAMAALAAPVAALAATAAFAAPAAALAANLAGPGSLLVIPWG